LTSLLVLAVLLAASAFTALYQRMYLVGGLLGAAATVAASYLAFMLAMESA
jgi:hypothetical protein